MKIDKCKRKSTLCIFDTLSTLGTFCNHPTEPEATRPQVEVTGDITKDTVWESGEDSVYSCDDIVIFKLR